MSCSDDHLSKEQGCFVTFRTLLPAHLLNPPRQAGTLSHVILGSLKRKKGKWTRLEAS